MARPVGRPKGSTKDKAMPTKVTITTVVNDKGEIIEVAKNKRGRKPRTAQEIKASGLELQRCSCCGKEKTLDQFYISNSKLHNFNHRFPTCKECVWALYEETLEKSQRDEKIAIFRMCQLMGVVFLENIYESSLEERNDKLARGMKNSSIFKLYMKNINSLPQYDDMEFLDGKQFTEEELAERKQIRLRGNLTERDLQNQETTIARLGYDPFEEEPIEDRKYLFNVLVDYLDDSILEDNFLLNSIISIVKSQRQVAKLDAQISSIINDPERMANNMSAVKSLVEAKKNISNAMLKTAEDNGISAKYNTTKSKGQGTLSGILGRLNDIGFESAKINMFDIETSKSLRQIADISNKSIIEQLNLDDSEWSSMVAEQRHLLTDLQGRYDIAKEECRLLRLLLRSKGISYDTKDLEQLKDRIIDVDDWVDEALEKKVHTIIEGRRVSLEDLAREECERDVEEEDRQQEAIINTETKEDIESVSEDNIGTEEIDEGNIPF